MPILLTPPRDPGLRIARRQRSVKSAEQISLQVGLGCESWAHFTGDHFAQSKECNGPTETVRAINSSEIASLTARHADSQPDNYRFAADVGLVQKSQFDFMDFFTHNYTHGFSNCTR